MRIGVMSDTHGQTRFAADAVRLLDSLGIEQLLHCGDIGSPAVVPIVSRWPAHFVLGNVDDQVEPLRQAIEAAGGRLHGRFGQLEPAGCPIAFLHGDDARRLQETIASGSWRLVCHGHTHIPACTRHGEVTVLNPGALYRAARHTVATVELPHLRVEHFAI